MEDRLPRKLAAIFYADVAEYSRLTGEDEEGTHRRLSEYLDLVSGEIARHQGKVVHYAGDAILADFNTGTAALTCAVSVQKKLVDRNRDLAEKQKVQFRIGINLGEVIVDRGDIYGDGVNIAARLEGLADAGGVCVSESVRSAIGSKLAVSYEFMGEQAVKNIREPLLAYQVRLDDGEVRPPPVLDLPELVPPDEPSVAVLPFTNMSGDPEQEYFSDGITEDIITALSKVVGLMVIARNSTFTYKGRAVDIKQVGKEQGVRYVLEGSVRKAGGRVRVTAQLNDAGSGHHLWAERYDRKIDDIFAVQDEITREVVVALDVRLSGGEQARIWSSGTKSLEAWECVRRSMEYLNSGTPESPLESERLCKRALDLDPNYSMAWVSLGWAHHHSVDAGVGHADVEGRESALESGVECGKRALELDPMCADAYSLLSLCHLSRREYEQALRMVETAVKLASNQAEILGLAALVLVKSGQPEKALEFIRRAMRLCPVYPGWFLWVMGMSYRLMGQTDSAIATFKVAVDRNEDFLSLHIGLASTFGEQGREAEARKSVESILRLAPNFSINKYLNGVSYRDQREISRIGDGLRKAGLSE
ncbi:adenylate/guanylate cyclase domain-containing protein [Pseudomonadota bacterium]